MSGVLCVWANLPDDAVEWYENEYIPDMRAQNSVHTLHCKLTQSGFEGQGDPIGRLDSPWPLCTVYEVEEIRKATDACYDKRNHPPDDMLAGPLAQARFDTRTYRELKRWQDDDWDGDISHIASVTCMEWRVLPEMQDEVIQWVFEVDNATVLQGTSYETKAKDTLHTYFTLVELSTIDYPWDVIFELAELEEWKQYFETQIAVKWQVGHYLVERFYTEENNRHPGTESDFSAQASCGGTSSESL